MAVMQWPSKQKPRLLWATIATILLFTTLFLTYPSPSVNLRVPFPRRTPDYPHRSEDSLDDVYNNTLGFQKIFVISLPSRVDQRDVMSLAAHLSGLSIEYVDGVTEVDSRTLPPGGQEAGMKSGQLGAWRAHVNVIRKIVEQNITSALVLEGDVDWDIRLKRQMQDFAKATRLLIQPIKGTAASPQYLDPTHMAHGNKNQWQPVNLNINKDLDRVEMPLTSPYGDIDKWDLLWPGHCGTTFPSANNKHKIPTGRVVIHEDDTVPEAQHIEIQFGDRQLQHHYPNHTRVISRAHGNICTLGYGISLPGARRFLYELALRKLHGSADFMFRDICDGVAGRPSGRTCFTVQPQIFQHHRPRASKSSFSDIVSHGNAFNKVAFTRNVRWSTRLNLERLLDGRRDYIDLFKDGEAANPDLGFG